MAYFGTPQARGKVAPIDSFQAGVQITDIVDFTFSTAFVAAADEVELFILPAGARLVRLQILCANITAINCAIGVMSGTAGDPDTARTVGTQVFSAQSMVDGEATATLANVLSVGIDRTKARGIGLTAAADIAAGGTKKITISYSYVF